MAGTRRGGDARVPADPGQVPGAAGADGGTHVANTREVGGIRVTGYESKGRINKRIRLELVEPA